MGECQELQIMLAEDSVDLYIISFLDEIKMHLVKLGTPWKSGLYRCTDFKLMKLQYRLYFTFGPLS